MISLSLSLPLSLSLRHTETHYLQILIWHAHLPEGVLQVAHVHGLCLHADLHNIYIHTIHTLTHTHTQTPTPTHAACTHTHTHRPLTHVSQGADQERYYRGSTSQTQPRAPLSQTPALCPLLPPPHRPRQAAARRGGYNGGGVRRHWRRSR